MTDFAKYNQIALFMQDLQNLLNDKKKLEKQTFRQKQVIDAIALDRDDLEEEVSNNYEVIENYKRRGDDLEWTLDECKEDKADLKKQLREALEEAKTWKAAYDGMKEEVEYYRKLEKDQKLKPKEVGDDEYIIHKRNNILEKQRKKKEQMKKQKEEEVIEDVDPGTRKMLGRMVNNLILKDPDGFDADFEPENQFAKNMFSDDED